MDSFNASEQVSWNEPLKQQALERLLADSSLGVVGLLELTGGTVGYFVVSWGYDLEWDGRDAFLTELFLVPTARGQRLGSAAMALVEGVAREHDARALHLMVREDNVVAQRLYARQGYVRPPRMFLSKRL